MAKLIWAEAPEIEKPEERKGTASAVSTAHTPKPAPEPAPAIPSVSYAGLLWQPQAYRETGQTDKKLFTYDQSLAHIKSAGYERHPRPAEVMSLFCAGLEGKLSAAEKAIADDLLAGYGEWVSLAWERQGNTLIAYLDPEGLVWDGRKYWKDNFQATEQREFDLTGKKSRRWIDVKYFGEDLIQYFYGRSLTALPPVMIEGSNRAQLYLPLEGRAWPVSRGNLRSSFIWSVFIGYDCFSYSRRASRGMCGREILSGNPR